MSCWMNEAVLSLRINESDGERLRNNVPATEDSISRRDVLYLPRTGRHTLRNQFKSSVYPQIRPLYTSLL